MDKNKSSSVVFKTVNLEKSQCCPGPETEVDLSNSC